MDKNKMNFHPENLDLSWGPHGTVAGPIDQAKQLVKILNLMGYDVIKRDLAA